jgi:probable rRNA maturation factor
LKKNLRIFFSYHHYKLPKKAQEIFQKILALVSKNDLVNLFFIGKRKSRQLNYQYRKINKPTDVLAFPFHYFYKKEVNFTKEETRDLGDIFICFPVAIKQAREKKCSLEKEVCFLFLHGLLHLLGYDHERAKERKTMFSLQSKILRRLNL